MAVLLVASCGGGSPAPGTSTPPATASAAASTNHGDAAAYQQFKDAAARFAALPAYTASYNARVNNPAGASFSATVVFTHKEKVTRVQFDGTVNARETHFTTVQDGDDLIVCQSQTSSCAQTTNKSDASPLASLDPIGILHTVSSDPSMTIAAASPQTFAGVAGSCYTVTQQAQKSTFCLDPATGILLLAVGQSGATGSQQFTESIAATSISTSVAAVDTSTPYALSGS